MVNFAVLRYKFSLLLLVFVIASCGNKPRVGHKTMVALMTDFMILEGGNQIQYNFANVPAYVWKRDYAGVCKKHGVDTSDFRITMNYLEKHPEEFSKIMEESITNLQQLEAKLKNSKH